MPTQRRDIGRSLSHTRSRWTISALSCCDRNTNAASEKEAALLLEFVMSPHTDNFYGLFFFVHLINKPVLDVEPAGESSLKISLQFFTGRRCPVRIFPQNFNQCLCFGVQLCRFQIGNVGCSFLCVDDGVHITILPRSPGHTRTAVFSVRPRSSLSYRGWN